ncbi:acetyl-CoA carboxylase carboxyltransferase subunit beta [Pseudoflavonifractor phocaeensis]|uniref:acetyl-CoA carboxylase carboxyltransferase subunit beta n=1 Tax=Pseudoflavonifractor phocaeensis TaxID=1870988 RepID=UPI00210BE636|nr:acetyl-CoA carboxylase carboxyltransferase subunit beta [Pseudoflavonifractor phocaeensis]MCQ4863259.1 acetyl-CoA carboxylase carboxyl transferase subunit beta [Pseudoflavonifractor phocaeensis]
MPFIQFSRKPKNALEAGGRTAPPAAAENELNKQCPNCHKSLPLSVLWENANTCPCGYHFRMNPRQRLDFLADPGSFTELFGEFSPSDPLDFPGYRKKLEKTQASCRERDAVLCGTAAIGGEKCALFIMDPYFMMGSMGMLVGEKITRLFEYAADQRLSVVGFTVSGGARMQEGILSLMQMAKTSGAVKRHSDAGGFYAAVLTNPTTGGVTASFAMEGDVILAEPEATIGFAGARVIESTVRKKLPPGFQTSEFLLEHGFVDAIVPRIRQRETLSWLLRMHRGGEAV